MQNDFYPKTGQMKPGICRSCGAEGYWISHHSGYHFINKRPLKVFLLDQGRFIRFDKAYESHFSTCPQADKWRKNKNAASALPSTVQPENKKVKNSGVS